MSTKLYFSVSCKILEVDIFFKLGEPPSPSKLESKNRFKSPAKIIFLESSYKKSLSYRSSSQRVFNCSTLVLALYKLTNIKGTSSITTPTTKVLPLLYFLVLITGNFFVVLNPITTPQELVVT